MILHLYMPSVEAELLTVQYRLAAILNFAATGHQGAVGFYRAACNAVAV